MKYTKITFKGLLPLLLIVCIDFLVLPSVAQVQTPLGQALSSSEQTLTATAVAGLGQELSSTRAVSHPPPAAPQMPHTGQMSTHAPSPAPALSSASPAAQAPPPPNKLRPPANARRTLFVEVAERKLRLEAPKKMCFIDRTASLTQEKIYNLLSAMAEKRRDQVLLAVFMNCTGISSPDDWSDGMPDAGFITWLNPSIGETTPMNRQDYLDMREASFPQYAKTREAGLTPDKAVHRNADNVSLGMTVGEQEHGLRDNSITVISTTVLQHMPVEITLHYAGDTPPKLKDVYAMMDKLMAQQIALNE